jgi:hypothetical protein
MTIWPQPTEQYGQTLGTCLPDLIGTLAACARAALVFIPRPATSAATAVPMVADDTFRNCRRFTFMVIPSFNWQLIATIPDIICATITLAEIVISQKIREFSGV